MNALDRCPGFLQIDNLRHDGGQITIDVLEIHLASFDFGNLQNVIDNADQCVGELQYDFCALAQSVTQIASGSSSVIPSTPFMGVRIS